MPDWNCQKMIVFMPYSRHCFAKVKASKNNRKYQIQKQPTASQNDLKLKPSILRCTVDKFTSNKKKMKDSNSPSRTPWNPLEPPWNPTPLPRLSLTPHGPLKDPKDAPGPFGDLKYNQFLTK